MLQPDYKENLEDYEEGLTNYWKEEMKLVQFIMNNDQNCYAHFPVDTNLLGMYDVLVREVQKE